MAICHRFSRLAGEVKAFGRGPFGKDDLVAVHQDVIMGDAWTRRAVDQIAAHKVRRTHQHLIRPKQHLPPPVRNQHPVRRRDQQIAGVAKGTSTDVDRRKVAARIHFAAQDRAYKTVAIVQRLQTHTLA
ncbi:MAG: hypothetical protein ABJX32_21965 [Tateyamaria sp.]